MQRPLLMTAGALIAGILTGSWAVLPALLLPLLLLLTTLAGVLYALRTGKKIFLSFLIVMSFFAFGLLAMSDKMSLLTRKAYLERFMGQDKVILDGTIVNIQELHDKRTGITLLVQRIASENVPDQNLGKIRLSLAHEIAVSADLAYGDYLRCRVRLRSPDRFRNHEKDLHFFQMRLQGVVAQGHISNPLDIIILRKDSGGSFVAAFQKLRQSLVDFVHRNTTPNARGIILAMTLGERAMISPDINESFQVTGTAHILSISGLHVAIIVAFSFLVCLGILKRFEWLILRFNIKTAACAVTIFPVIAYAALSGGSVPVQRAGIMTLAFLAALCLGRVRDLGNVLALAAILILALNPEKLWNISFQLSFSAVAGILFMLPHFQKPSTDSKSWPKILGRTVKNFLLVTIGATIGTWPLVAYHFHYFSLSAPLANFLVVPTLGFITLPLSLAAIVISFVSQSLAVLLLSVASAVVDWVVYLNHFIAALPFSSLLLVPPPSGGIAFYYIFLAVAASMRESPRISSLSPFPRSFAFVLMFFLVSAGLYWHYQGKSPPGGQLKVTMLDVGQGSATLIQSPSGEHILVDGGGLQTDTFDLGKRVIAPYLLSRGINKLDLVILTHPHRDHLQGLIHILNKFPVREVWTNGHTGIDEDWLMFAEIIRRKKIPHRVVLSDSGIIRRGGISFTFFNPEPDGKNRPPAGKLYDWLNEGSLVFQVTYGNHRFLFTGDIGRITEEQLVLAKHPLASQVIMAPHHGSRFSSSEVFLAAAQPKIALVSGRGDGLVKLPHPETLQRYQKRGITILRTDRHGAVTLKSDGVTLMIRTMLE